MNDFTIWTVPGSPFARAVAAVLVEKGAPFSVVGLSPADVKSPEHLERHPFGRMPAFRHGDFMLYETQAVLRYLERILPSPTLIPTDPRQAARMDQVMGINDWYLFQGVGSVIGFHRVIGPMLLGLTPDEVAVAAAMPKAHVVFGELSRLLGDQHWFAGDAISLADFTVVGILDILSLAPEWTELTAERPNLVAWLERMRARPSVTQTTMQAVQAMAQAA
jgi:glutathione S-transferase